MLPGTDYILIGLAEVPLQSLPLMSINLSQCRYQSSAVPSSNSCLPPIHLGDDLTGSQELLRVLGGGGAAGRCVGGGVSPCHKTEPFPEDILAEQSFHPEPSSNTP